MLLTSHPNFNTTSKRPYYPETKPLQVLALFSIFTHSSDTVQDSTRFKNLWRGSESNTHIRFLLKVSIFRPCQTGWCTGRRTGASPCCSGSRRSWRPAWGRWSGARRRSAWRCAAASPAAWRISWCSQFTSCRRPCAGECWGNGGTGRLPRRGCWDPRAATARAGAARTLPGGYSPCAPTTRLTSNASTRRSPTVMTTHSLWRKRCGTSFTTLAFGEALLTENEEKPRKRKRNCNYNCKMLFPNPTQRLFLTPPFIIQVHTQFVCTIFFIYGNENATLPFRPYKYLSIFFETIFFFFVYRVFRWSFSGCVKFCARFRLCEVLSTFWWWSARFSAATL